MGTEHRHRPDCDECDWTGRVTCGDCGGSGRHGLYPERDKCIYCDGGSKQCSSCGGTGKS